MDEFAFAEVNGHRLRYRLRGEGPLTVFGHGILGSIEQLLADPAGLERLEQRLRILFYDARGHGQSAGPAEATGYSWETMGQDMAHFVETHGQGPAILGGASMGAATALWVALERPELVRALVVMMPPPLGFETMRAAEERQAIAMLEALGVAIENFGLETTVANLATWPGFAANDEEREARAAWLRSQNPATVLHVIKGLSGSPFHDPELYRGSRRRYWFWHTKGMGCTRLGRRGCLRSGRPTHGCLWPMNPGIGRSSRRRCSPRWRRFSTSLASA